MDLRWKEIARDSKREVKVVLHPTAAIWDVRRGLDPGSDDSIDLSAYVSTCTQTAFDCNVTFKFNRELFGATQPRPNQILEIQLKQGGKWQPLWLGIVDSISQFQLSRGERSMQLIAKTREQGDIWKKTKRVTPLFPQLTNLTYIAQRVARSAGMQGDEILLPPSSMTTAHSNTQLAEMNAWDMIDAVFVPLGWTPFIDAIGRLRAADRNLQSRVSDQILTEDRMVKVGGSRQRPPASRVRVFWLNPTLKINKQMGRKITEVPVTVGWFMPVYWKHVDFSEDKTQRAMDTFAVENPSVNKFLPCVQWKWTQQSTTGGRLFFTNWNFALMAGLIVSWYTVIPLVLDEAPPMGGPVIPIGRKAQAIFQTAFALALMNMGSGVYEIWGNPYDWVHARNTSEAFDSSVPEWVDNAVDIETDFIVNEEHAKTTAIRELIYQARAVSKWNAVLVDDPRIEYGDILKFPDGSQLFVEDYSRQLARGEEAVIDVKGFLLGAARGVGGSIQGDVPELPGGVPGGGGGPGTGGGGSGGGGGTGPITTGKGSQSDPIVAMSSNSSQITKDVAASLAFFGSSATNTDASYWISKASTAEQFSDGLWYLGWNKYWEDRMTPGNTGSADPAGGKQPAQHLDAYWTTQPPPGESGGGDSGAAVPNGRWAVDAVNAEFPDLLKTNTKTSCGIFTEKVAQKLAAGDPLWGHVGKSGGQTQYNGHAIDAVMWKGNLSKAVDIIGSSDGAPNPGSPQWGVTTSGGQPWVAA